VNPVKWQMGTVMELAQIKPGRGFNPLHSFIYLANRVVTHRSLRSFVVAALRKGIEASQGPLTTGEAMLDAERASLLLLNETGYVPLLGLLSGQRVADIHEFMHDKQLHDRVRGGRVYTLDSVPEDAKIGDSDLKDIINCPHILALANSASLLCLGAHYFGCKPTLSALGMRWSFPGTEASSILQLFHRDTEDWRFLKIFVYLTDVDADSGPHVYVRASHVDSGSLRAHSYSDEAVERAYGMDSVINVTGPAGFGFAADTAGIHKGAVPLRRNRCMLQFQYSLLPTYAYRYRPAPYSGTVALDRYVNRLMVL
jgi:hypothetical protein